MNSFSKNIFRFKKKTNERAFVKNKTIFLFDFISPIFTHTDPHKQVHREENDTGIARETKNEHNCNRMEINKRRVSHCNNKKNNNNDNTNKTFKTIIHDKISTSISSSHFVISST